MASPSMHEQTLQLLCCWISALIIVNTVLLHQVALHGIIPANNGKLEGLKQNATQWSNRLKQAAAVCHSLTMVHKQLVVGDAMEHSFFKLVEAHFLVRSYGSDHDVCHSPAAQL